MEPNDGSTDDSSETGCSSPTPFTPPTTEEERLSWLRLIRSPRVGPATFLRLLSDHGSAAAAIAALPGIAAAAGVADYAPCPVDAARAEMERGLRLGAMPICLGAPEYPPALAALDDPPPLIWALGRRANLPLLARPAVGLVGARSASALGLRMARALAGGLGAAGLVTVSGLARGIDTEVHGATLDTGTLAVMAGGVDAIYPPENATLAAVIADRGLRLSEQPPGMVAQARHFPRRNRLIAGLSRAVVVIEAAEGSGSLITAQDALDQGREVLAVPGHPMDPRAAGGNRLIVEGARLARGVGDVLAALGELRLVPGRGGHAGTAADMPGRGTASDRSPRMPQPRAGHGGAVGQTETRAARPGAEGGGAAPAPAITRATHPTGAARDASAPGGDRWGAPPHEAPRGPGTPRARDAGHTPAEGAMRGQHGPDLGAGAGPAEGGTTVDPARLQARLLAALSGSGLAEDALLRTIGISATDAAPALLFLELAGRIRRAPGGMLSLA
jgi:DNA processing protein